ncbi:MAG TPA: MCP four helix bundle domain-containing protein, partial [Tepidisphaeraceae bacterium]|nr:MCP four helix bundle domain-containing protein [Tepidisphaeraceae bacterium]
MSGMTIGRRVALGFGSVLAITLALGIFSYYKFSSLSKSVDHLVEQSVPALVHAADAARASEREAAYALQHLVNTDKAEMDRIEAQLIEVTRSANEALDQYEKLIDSEENRRRLAEARRARTEWATIKAQIIAHS